MVIVENNVINKEIIFLMLQVMGNDKICKKNNEQLKSVEFCYNQFFIMFYHFLS